ncbi:MAG TPA: hypothetical protein VFA26_23210 [Gemmataceae bacterium]|nr:hypothetical protein [Gemmataceae bacterium]
MDSPTRRQKLEMMLAAEPNDPLLRYMLAMEHVSAGDDAGAVERFRELHAVAPDYVPGYMQGGQALARLGRVAEARAEFEAGIAAARKQGDAHAAEEMQGMLAGLE